MLNKLEEKVSVMNQDEEIKEFLKELKEKRCLKKKQVQKIKDEIQLGLSLKTTYIFLCS